MSASVSVLGVRRIAASRKSVDVPADIWERNESVTAMTALRSVAITLLVCSLVVGGVVAADTASNGHDGNCETGATYVMQMSDCVDTPDRVVTLEGDDYTVSAIGVVSPGETISVSVGAPNQESYSVYLYNSNRNIEDNTVLDGSGTATFDTSELSSGSYMLAVNGPDGNIRTVYPVVVRSYRASLDAPANAEPGEEVTFTVSVENVSGTAKQLEEVNVVVSKDGDDEELTATESNAGTYTVTTTLDESGSWLVYANVRGSDIINGQQELLGAAHSAVIDVQESTPTETATDTEQKSSDTGGSDDGDSSVDTPTKTVTDTVNETVTEPVTETETQTEDETETDTETETVTDTETTTTTDSVITPEDSTETRTTGALSPLLAVLALFVVGLSRR